MPLGQPKTDARDPQNQGYESWESRYRGLEIIRKSDIKAQNTIILNGKERIKELEAKVKQLETEVEELKKLKEQTEEQTLAKLFKKMLA